MCSNCYAIVFHPLSLFLYTYILFLTHPYTQVLWLPPDPSRSRVVPISNSHFAHSRPYPSHILLAVRLTEPVLSPIRPLLRILVMLLLCPSLVDSPEFIRAGIVTESINEQPHPHVAISRKRNISSDDNILFRPLRFAPYPAFSPPKLIAVVKRRAPQFSSPSVSAISALLYYRRVREISEGGSSRPSFTSRCLDETLYQYPGKPELIWPPLPDCFLDVC